MALSLVTFTGADDATKGSELLSISKDYPFVEWGILLSASSQGGLRFPSFDWLKQVDFSGANLSLHICGRWVREICQGKWDDFLREVPESSLYQAQRVQLNFHSYVHDLEDRFFEAIPALGERFGWQFIFQVDGVNDELQKKASAAGFDAVPLFDKSGGAGVLPEDWPESTSFSGYAGGLGPHNLSAQLALIRERAHDDFWVDMETKVRSRLEHYVGEQHFPRDTFDLKKVKSCLDIAGEIAVDV